jgi:hypothetical protein
MRIPRMTSRRWMITVTTLAILMGASIEVNRQLTLARRYRLLAFSYDQALLMNRNQKSYGIVVFPWGVTVRNACSPELVAYYELMRRKYRRAAARPWLAVEPDPPAPEYPPPGRWPDPYPSDLPPPQRAQDGATETGSLPSFRVIED